MKRHTVKFAGPVVFVAVLCSGVGVNAGDLNPPPGAIAPTNCTQLNAQAITLPFTITTSGCYVLTSNLTGALGVDGIIISSDHVTLDLNGFALIGASSLNGILVSGVHKNIAILNGVVTGWAFDGVSAANAVDSQLKDLRASNNGLAGLRIGVDCTVSSCTADGNGTDGIRAGGGTLITNCTASDNGSNGIGTQAFCTIKDCTARGNTDNGIVTSDSTVAGCTVSQNSDDGIEVITRSHVVGNTCISNTGAGIHVSLPAGAGDNRIEGNHVVTNGGSGVLIDSAGNLIIKNSASGNGTNYSIAPGNDAGPIGSAATSTSPWANIEF